MATTNRPAADETLDLTDVACPHNSSQAIMRLEWMDPGELLQLVIDDGEAYQNVPVTLKQEGHEVLDIRRTGDQWTLLVRRGPDV
jgi:tRNA 2-thiouridine synthesizing protein A